jgi:hypothetical protein
MSKGKNKDIDSKMSKRLNDQYLETENIGLNVCRKSIKQKNTVIILRNCKQIYLNESNTNTVIDNKKSCYTMLLL